MQKYFKILFFIITASICKLSTVIVPTPVLADSLERIEERIKDHSETILNQLENKEQAVERMLDRQENNLDSKSYTVNGQRVQGAQEHPWLRNGTPRGVNPNHRSDYRADSKNAWDTLNNLEQTWSCFEPQLVAYGDCEQRVRGSTWDTADPLLSNTCRQYCCAQEQVAYLTWLRLRPLAPESDVLIGGGGDFWRNRGRNNDEYYEVIQFWYPENEVSINNYGRMRNNPAALTGVNQASFLRDTLVRNKTSADRQITQELDRNIGATNNRTSDNIEKDFRQDPFTGQAQSGEDIDHFAAHVYRTHLSSQLGDNMLSGLDRRRGFDRDRRSIYSALEPSTNEKYQLNIWTEYDYFDYLTSVDSASFSIRGDEANRSQRFMNALYGRSGNWIDQAEDGPQQNLGQAAYRAGRWNQFRELTDIAEINGRSGGVLEEIVYFGGSSLYPLSLTFDNAHLSEAHKRAIAARRGFEIGGNEVLARRFPGNQRSRMNTFTINGLVKSLEVDKIQRIYPLNQNGEAPECYRSQKIPNNLQQTENQWAREQFPTDLMGDVSEDNSDSAYIYWNKRVACTCKRDGPLFGRGAVAMNFPFDIYGGGRGDGDRVYGKLERTLCTYREGELPSAFAGEQRPTCTNGRGQTKIYRGLTDFEVLNSGYR